MKTFGLKLLSLDCTQGKCDEEEEADEDDDEDDDEDAAADDADSDRNRAKIYMSPLYKGVT